MDASEYQFTLKMFNAILPSTGVFAQLVQCECL